MKTWRIISKMDYTPCIFRTKPDFNSSRRQAGPGPQQARTLLSPTQNMPTTQPSSLPHERMQSG